jgi:guanosine-3',5'-bis(diphosphate) 3'-pyrophosphohydrolase
MKMKNQDLSILLKAMRFAAEKHKDQRRKDKEASPYINHPIAVADTLLSVGRIKDMIILVSAILHDTIEDTETTPEELEKEFGGEVRALVQEVSDDKSLPKEERKRLQIENARHKSERARLIKLADKICNLQDILACPPATWSAERKRKYVEWAKAVIEEIRGINREMERVFDSLCLQAWHQFGEQVPMPSPDESDFGPPPIGF